MIKVLLGLLQKENIHKRSLVRHQLRLIRICTVLSLSPISFFFLFIEIKTVDHGI